MSTALATTAQSDLVLAGDQTFWTDNQIAVLNQLGVTNAAPADLAVFFHQCTRTGLDPFARQIYMIERQGKQTIQTGIDGFRLIARRAVDRSGETLGYEDTQWCDQSGNWTDVWLHNEAPAAARVAVLRQGQRYPAIALFSEYAATKRAGGLTQMWATKPALMLAKCAEALALRKAFPQDLSGLYTSDEMGRADGPLTQPAASQPSQEQREAHNVAPASSRAKPLVTQEQLDATLRLIAEAQNQDDLDAVLKTAAGLDFAEHAADLRAIWNARAEELAKPQDNEGVVDVETVEPEQTTIDAETEAAPA